MAFQPIDLQVSFLQSSNVADAASHEQEAPRRAREDRAREELRRSRLEENTPDETGDQSESKSVGDDEGGENPLHGQSGASGGEEKEDEESSRSYQGESDKGTYLDFTT